MKLAQDEVARWLPALAQVRKQHGAHDQQHRYPGPHATVKRQRTEQHSRNEPTSAMTGSLQQGGDKPRNECHAQALMDATDHRVRE